MGAARDKGGGFMARNYKEKIKKGDLIFYALMLALPLASLAVFYFGVNANSFLLAFQKYDQERGAFVFEGLSAFRRVFDDFGGIVMRIAFRNSLLAYLTGICVTMPLGVLFSYYVFKNFPLSGAFRVIFYLPSIIASIVLVLIFKYFVEKFLPEIIYKVSGKAIPGLLVDTSVALPFLLFYGVFTGFGGSILLYSGSMRSINESIIESARLDGVNSVQEITRIVLPLMWPTFVTFIVTGLAGFFGNQIHAFDFYGQNAEFSIYTVGYYMFSLTARGSNSLPEYPYLSAMGLTLTLIIAPVTLGVRYLLIKFGPSEN
ncbi:MAG: sugar ABC transporter permease [Clostridiales bacterium]|jgi:ABC-type sugar transport system permease subunit|nr:sugar ABC transporter permease [Clostridiales bacterium]